MPGRGRTRSPSPLPTTRERSGQKSGSVTVSSGGGGGSSIVLSVSGKTDATKQYMTLTWTGATGATVDVYRNGPSSKNDLERWEVRQFPEPAGLALLRVQGVPGRDEHVLEQRHRDLLTRPPPP